MSQKKIKVRITRNGEIKIEAQGFHGSNCAAATEFLKSLGDTTDFETKAEWYEENVKLEEKLGLNLDFDSDLCG